MDAELNFKNILADIKPLASVNQTFAICQIDPTQHLLKYSDRLPRNETQFSGVHATVMQQRSCPKQQTCTDCHCFRNFILPVFEVRESKLGWTVEFGKITLVVRYSWLRSPSILTTAASFCHQRCDNGSNSSIFQEHCVILSTPPVHSIHLFPFLSIVYRAR